MMSFNYLLMIKTLIKICFGYFNHNKIKMF